MERITTISARLKEYRSKNNLTLAELERITGIPAQTLNRYELGQRAPKIDIAVKIADTLDINPLWIQGYNVPMEKEKPASVFESGPCDKNIIRVIGRDGSFTEKHLTDEQMAAYKILIDSLPDADDL